MRRCAFTLIELLIVIGVILLLAAMLIPVMNLVLWQARALKTEQRLQGLQTALQQYGDATTLHSKVLFPLLTAAGEPTGVTAFRVSVGQGSIGGDGGGNLLPRTGAWLQLDTARPWLFLHPWGTATFPTTAPADGITPWTGPASEAPLVRHLGNLSILANIALLRAAGVIEQEAQWLTDRSKNQVWNDAWGNPLVVAFGLFQPPQNTAITSRWRGAVGSERTSVIFPDLFLKHAKQLYGHDRAVYLSFAAVGDTVRTPLAGTADALAANLWTQVTDTCEASQWDAAAWTTKPSGWAATTHRGKKTVGGKNERCFLTVPIEIR